MCTGGDALRSLTARVGCCTESSSVPVKFKVIPPLEVQDPYTHCDLSECRMYQLTYAGMVIVGVTADKVGSLLKVNSTLAPVTLALLMRTTTEPVEGRNEVL